MPDDAPRENDPVSIDILTDVDRFTAMALAMNRFREKFIAMLEGATDHDKLAWYFALRTVVKGVEDRDPAYKTVGDAYLDLWYAVKRMHDIDPKDFHGNLPDGAKRKG